MIEQIDIYNFGTYCILLFYILLIISIYAFSSTIYSLIILLIICVQLATIYIWYLLPDSVLQKIIKM